MTITIQADVLARAMRHAASIVQSSVTIPILSNVCLTASGDDLVIVTSDMDTEYRQRLPLAAAGEIAVTVEAQRLHKLAGAAEHGAQISITLDDRRVTIRSGRTRWVLPMLPVTDFPSMPVDALIKPVEMPGPALAAAISRTAWAIGTEVTRHWYTGLSLHASDGVICMAGADGNILAALATATPWPKGAPDVLVPARFIRTLERLAGDAETVQLSWDDRKIHAVMGDITLTGKLIDSQFPEWRRVADMLKEKRSEATSVTVDPALLKSAIRRVELVASEKSRCLRFTRREGCIEIGMNDVDGRLATEEIPAEAQDAHENGLNVRYLTQMLDAIGGDTIAIDQENPGSPILVERKVPDGSLGIIGAMAL